MQDTENIEGTEIISTGSDGMTYRKVDGKVVSRQVICHVRQYQITKHLHGKLPEALLLDKPAYRVSQGKSLMTFIDFPDLDTAIEYATGFVIKQAAEEIQARFKDVWKETYERMAAQTISISNDGVVSYGEGIA